MKAASARARPGPAHGMDDAGKRGVAGGGGDAVFERARGVDRGGVDRVALGLFHRQAFAGDGRLVHGRAAADDLAVGGDAFAGPHAHDVAWLQLRGRLLPRAVGLPARGGLGARSSRPRMALRARSSERASISSATLNRNITMAASGHWPISTAPVTAMLIRALMLRLPLRTAIQPCGRCPGRRPDGGHGQRGGDVDGPAGEMRELGQRGHQAGAADGPPVHGLGGGRGRARRVSVSGSGVMPSDLMAAVMRSSAFGVNHWSARAASG